MLVLCICSSVVLGFVVISLLPALYSVPPHAFPCPGFSVTDFFCNFFPYFEAYNNDKYSEKLEV